MNNSLSGRQTVPEATQLAIQDLINRRRIKSFWMKQRIQEIYQTKSLRQQLPRHLTPPQWPREPKSQNSHSLGPTHTGLSTADPSSPMEDRPILEVISTSHYLRAKSQRCRCALSIPKSGPRVQASRWTGYGNASCHLPTRSARDWPECEPKIFWLLLRSSRACTNLNAALWFKQWTSLAQLQISLCFLWNVQRKISSRKGSSSKPFRPFVFSLQWKRLRRTRFLDPSPRRRGIVEKCSRICGGPLILKCTRSTYSLRPWTNMSCLGNGMRWDTLHLFLLLSLVLREIYSGIQIISSSNAGFQKPTKRLFSNILAYSRKSESYSDPGGARNPKSSSVTRPITRLTARTGPDLVLVSRGEESIVPIQMSRYLDPAGLQIWRKRGQRQCIMIAY